jgi:hypothetical protein
MVGRDRPMTFLAGEDPKISSRHWGSRAIGRGFLGMRIPAPGCKPVKLFFNKKGIDSRQPVRLLYDRLLKT